MIWLCLVLVASIGGIVAVYVADIRAEHRRQLPHELAYGNLRVRRRMRNLARMHKQAGVIRAEFTFGWVWVYVPRRRRSDRKSDPNEQVGWALTRREARRQLAAAVKGAPVKRNEAGGAVGAVLGTIAAVIGVAWYLQYSGRMEPQAFFQAIADWLNAAFTWLFG